MKKRIVLVALALTVSAVSFAAGAFASIPGANGVIHGCFRKADGRLRVINTDQGKTCVTGERTLDWNRRGRRGPQGIQGDQGIRGKRGLQGIQGIQGDPGVTSPSVKHLTTTALVSDTPTTQTISWTQPAGTLATNAWVRRTFVTPPGPCDSLSDTGGAFVTLKLNGIDVWPSGGTSDPGTTDVPALGGDPLGSVLLPGDYDLVAHFDGQLVPACFGTQVTVDVFVETVAAES
jgi:hypothetical protein